MRRRTARCAACVAIVLCSTAGVAFGGSAVRVDASKTRNPTRDAQVSHARECGGAEAGPAGSAAEGVAGSPEVATGFASRDVAYTSTVMAVTANPVASRVACEILVAGGSAVDAAVAAQMALNLVEPQSSGIGGGAFMLVYDARRRTVTSYDGRETAPLAARPDDLRWVDETTDRSTPRPSTRASGRSIGVPGAVAMLDLAHRDHGRLPWRTLFAPAIALATDGFRIGPRMSASIDYEKRNLARDPAAAAYFLDAAGDAKRAGTLLRNPALAQTFASIARDGPRAFYTGDIARAIVAAVGRGDTSAGSVLTPGRMSLHDLAGYRAKRRAPVCAPYRAYVVCGMGPPSSGGMTVTATLGILETFDLGSLAPLSLDRDGGHPDPRAVHLIAEAERLAYADRDRYEADTDFVPLPGGSTAALLDRDYLRSRAALIDLQHSMGRAQPGDFGPVQRGMGPVEEHGTTHLVIADARGNVVSMTTTVESGFGSFHMVRGFLLNNQLTDFSVTPTDADGAPIANSVAGGKRPRSTMAPTLVFAGQGYATSVGERPLTQSLDIATPALVASTRRLQRQTGDEEPAAPAQGPTKATKLSPTSASGVVGVVGDFVMATGSAGGSVIVQYVVKTLVGALDWGLDAQQAVSSIDFGAMNSPTTYVGGEHPDVDASDGGVHDALVMALRGFGHTVSVAPHSSGLTALRRTTRGGRPRWQGGADPRREGVARGDSPGP